MYTTLFRNRNFLLLWLTQLSTTLGNELYDIGMMVVIFQRTGSAFQASGILVAKMLPSFILGPVAGTVVDRAPHKWVMAMTNLLRALLVLLALVFGQHGMLNIWSIYVMVLGLTVADTFYKPAQQAMLPYLTAPTLLIQANSALTLITLAAFSLAFVLAGWLVVHLGEQMLVLANLSCFVLGAWFAAQIQVKTQPVAAHFSLSPPTLWDSFFEGITYLRAHKLARTIMTLEFIEYWPHAMWTSAITLTFVRQALHTTPEVWGIQNSLYYTGQLIGAVGALIFANRLARQPGWVIVVDIGVTTLLNFCYAISPNVPFALLVCFAFGPPASLRDVAQNTLLQASVHGAMLGRVYATRQMLLNVITMLAGASFAWLADHYPVRWLFFGGTLLYGIAFVYAWSHLTLRQAKLQANVLLSSAD